MQPENLEETRDWLVKAKEDLDAAKCLLGGEFPLIAPALFHCQQAAEKALKAFLTWSNRPFPRTHDLVALLALCASIEPSSSVLEDAAVTLTPYAVVFRYPSEAPAPAADQSEEALRLARQALSFVLDRLPPEVT